MTTETEFRERVMRSGLLDADENVIAFVCGWGGGSPRITSPLKFMSAAMAPYRPSKWRTIVLTDRQLYVCSQGYRGGSLKSVLAKYPRGSFTASMTDGRFFTLEQEEILCTPGDWMGRYADMIVAAGKPGDSAES